MLKSGVPVISNWTNSGSAGDDLVLSGDNLGPDLVVSISGIAPNGLSFQLQASVVSASGSGAVVQLPSGLPPDTVYQLSAENSQGAAAPVLVNAPQVWWVGPNEIEAGGMTSLFGQNLVLGPGDHPSVVMQMTSGTHVGETFSLGVIDANSFRVDVQVPSDLPQGTYSIQYNSGAGGAMAVSQTLAPTITVDTASVAAARAILNIADFGATANNGQDAAGAFDAAMAAAKALLANGTGLTSVTVELGTGEYNLSHSIAIPDGVDLEGMGMDKTTLKATPNFHFVGPSDGILWAHASVEGTGPNLANVAIANLTIDTGGNSTATATYDSPSYSTFLSAVDGRNTDHLTLTNVQILAKGGTNAIDVCDASHFTLENSIVVGPAIQLGAGSQIFIHGNAFYGTDQSVANIFGLGASDVAIFGNTAQDLNPNATTGAAVLSDTYQGRFYYDLAYKGSQDVNQYIAQNQTSNIAPRVEAASLGVLENTGEQILFENSVVSPGLTSQFSLDGGLFKAATPFSLALNLSAPNISSAGNTGLLTVVSGTGAGETTQIDHYNASTGTYYFSDPLPVLPDATSVLLISQTPTHIAVVNNSLDGRAQDVTSSVVTASAGVEVYPGGSHVVVSQNAFSDLTTGVQLWSFDAPNSSTFVGTNYFDIVNNTFNNVNDGVANQVGHPVMGSLPTDSLNAYQLTGTTIQHNDFSGVNQEAFDFSVLGSVNGAALNVASQNILPLTTAAKTMLLSGTTAANSPVSVYDGMIQIGTTKASASGAWSFSTGTLTDGVHVFTSTAVDAAGHITAASVALSITVAGAVSVAPTLVSFSPDTAVIGDGITNSNHLTLTGTAAAGSTIQLYDGVVLLGTTIADASGVLRFTTPVLSDGVHDFTVKNVDSANIVGAASNLAPVSSPLRVTVDTSAPVVAVSLTKDTGPSPADSVTAAGGLAGSADPNAVVTVKEGNTTLGTSIADVSGHWTFAAAGLLDGSHTISASETDAAGNIGTASLTFTLDTKAPPVTAVLAKDSGLSSSDGITFSSVLTGSGDPNAIVTLKEGANILGVATADANGHWTFMNAGLADGKHTIVATETDTAGNTGTASLTFTLDTKTPAPIITNETLAQGSKVMLAGTASEANAMVSVYDGSNLLGTIKADSNGVWSFSAGKISGAVHTFTVTATDIAGNTGRGANEAILGGSKGDNLVGTSANDIIVGNGGNDKFTGGGGSDVMTAGSGNDHFVFTAIGDSTPASYDTIFNFRHGYDAIDFTNIAGIGGTNGVPNFQGQLAGSGSLTLNAHGIGYIEVGGNTEVLVNTTNSAETLTALDTHAASMEIVLAGIRLGLTKADFHFV